jgi:hypothetical protein
MRAIHRYVECTSTTCTRIWQNKSEYVLCSPTCMCKHIHVSRTRTYAGYCVCTFACMHLDSSWSLLVHACISVYVCIYICVCVYKYSAACDHLETSRSPSVCACMRVYVCVSMYLCVCKYIHLLATTLKPPDLHRNRSARKLCHVYFHTHIHIYTRTHTYTNIHTQTYITRTHIHTCIQATKSSQVHSCLITHENTLIHYTAKFRVMLGALICMCFETVSILILFRVCLCWRKESMQNHTRYSVIALDVVL